MAEFSLYKCEKCGYEVNTEPRGFYGLFSGQYYNFKCMGCRNIVSISANDLAKMGYFPRCPECNENDHLSTWNPIDGTCPKCGGKMKDTGMIMMAD